MVLMSKRLAMLILRYGFILFLTSNLWTGESYFLRLNYSLTLKEFQILSRSYFPNNLFPIYPYIFLLRVVYGTDVNLFTTKPKNKEVFVGDSVTFDWDYRKEEDIVSVRFGIVSNTSEGATIALTLFAQKPNDVHYLNTQVPKFVDLVHRINFVEGKRASFKISNLRMNESGTYFCMLKKRGEIKTFTDNVDLKVVGK